RHVRAFHCFPTRRSSDLRGLVEHDPATADVDLGGGGAEVDSQVATQRGPPARRRPRAPTRVHHHVIVDTDDGPAPADARSRTPRDRKSTRLNSSHVKISY